ncbi:MAG: shikimate dehydrogenase [Rhizobiales bacterium]|nr:shikimate dehydrogenase [Hyphomicrobiales bacterium]
MIRACVIGFPIKHSRSPMIHGHWLKQFGIAGEYARVEVRPEELREFLGTLPERGLAGCNITLPHKEPACNYVQHLDDRGRRTGSINTVYVRDGQTFATSTDGEGFVENILWRLPSFSFSGKTALILGAGGTSRALIDEMLRRGADHVLLANRTPEKAEKIAKVFPGQVTALSLAHLDDALSCADLLVNATSAGIADAAKIVVPFARLKQDAVVTDVNYVPLVTPFLQEAAAHGHVVVPGLGMLLHQAVPGFELWFGKRPVVNDALYTLIARDIDPGYAG